MCVICDAWRVMHVCVYCARVMCDARCVMCACASDPRCVMRDVCVCAMWDVECVTCDVSCLVCDASSVMCVWMRADVH